MLRTCYSLSINLLADSADKDSKTEEATAAFVKAEAGDPANAEVQYYLATSALNAGKTEECITRLEKYLVMGPKSDQNKATATGLLAALKPKN